MTRMIFCDLDGTLLPAGCDNIPAETLAQVKRLVDKGVLFCVASGRPYSSLKKFFGPLYRRIIFICLDGALIMHRDCVLYKKRIENPSELLDNTIKAVLYSRTAEYILPADMPFSRRMDTVNRAGGEVYKIALYGESEPGPHTQICYKRDGICEFVSRGTDKGVAAKLVMEKFRVAREQTASLGDGDNDLPLLLATEKGFRMAACHASLADRGFTPVSGACEFLSMF